MKPAWRGPGQDGDCLVAKPRNDTHASGLQRQDSCAHNRLGLHHHHFQSRCELLSGALCKPGVRHAGAKGCHGDAFVFEFAVQGFGETKHVGFAAE